MATSTGVWKLVPNETILAAGTFTSEAVEVGRATAFALHLSAISGAGLDVSFTYSLSTSKEGVFITGEEVIGVNIGALKVMDFAPELGQYMKLTVTNNNAGAPVTLTAALVVQED